ALGVGHFEFFYTLYLVDQRAAELARADALPAYAHRPDGGELASLPPFFRVHPMLSEPTDQAFSRVFADLLVLYRRVFEQVVCSGEGDRAASLNGVKVSI